MSFSEPASIERDGWEHIAGLFLDRHADGLSDLASCIAVETPIGFVFGGIPHAVMMATPADLEDFVFGFALTEGIIDEAEDITAVKFERTARGLEARISITAPCLQRFLSRRRTRNLRGHTSCGLCGIEDLTGLAEDVVAQVRQGEPPTGAALNAAFQSLREFQPLSRATHGSHAAGWFASEGAPRMVREDVGRHNALDKLIGAALRAKADLSDGFVLISSRCSFEMAQKAIRSGASVLVSASAPTALAIEMARTAGLILIAPHLSRAPMIFADARS